MSDQESNPSSPPPLIGASSFSDSSEEKDVASKDKDTDDDKGQVEAEEIVEVFPDARIDPYGETTLGFSVTAVDDKDRPEVEEPKTAFNTPKEEVPTPTGANSNWGHPLHATVDPYESKQGSPFDKPDGDFIGTDPYRAVLSEVRGVDNPSGS